jgi:hypothetical protein
MIVIFRKSILGRDHSGSIKYQARSIPKRSAKDHDHPTSLIFLDLWFKQDHPIFSGKKDQSVFSPTPDSRNFGKG